MKDEILHFKNGSRSGLVEAKPFFQSSKLSSINIKIDLSFVDALLATSCEQPPVLFLADSAHSVYCIVFPVVFECANLQNNGVIKSPPRPQAPSPDPQHGHGGGPRCSIIDFGCVL